MQANRFVVALFVALSVRSGVAEGGVIMYSASVPLTPTNSSRQIELPQFNPAIGSLQSVELSLFGHVEGTARFESLNATPRTVTMNLAARIELKDDVGIPISSTLPIASITDTAAGFDGVLDFGGASGRTHDDLSADTMAPLRNYTDPVDLARFTGANQMLFPVSGTGASSASGPGNIVYQFTTLTSAWIAVTYQYASIPEPAACSLLCVSGLLLRRRR